MEVEVEVAMAMALTASWTTFGQLALRKHNKSRASPNCVRLG